MDALVYPPCSYILLDTVACMYKRMFIYVHGCNHCLHQRASVRLWLLVGVVNVILHEHNWIE